MTAAAYTYPYARPALSVDAVVFGLAEEGLRVLLVERGEAPFAGTWALPGGFVHIDEGLEQAARRELEEETGVRLAYLEQLYTFGAPDRDPRERVVTVAWFGLVKPEHHVLSAATDAADTRWFDVHDVPPLAFDHAHILRTALTRLKGKLSWQPIGFDLLPDRFTLSELQRLYEVVLERPLDKRNFRKKVQRMGVLVPLDERQKGVAHRAARLYRFDRARYQRLASQGFDFEL